MTETEKNLAEVARSACFHYWNCEGQCNEFRGSMALLAKACGFTDAGTDDNIEEALRA